MMIAPRIFEKLIAPVSAALLCALFWVSPFAQHAPLLALAVLVACAAALWALLDFEFFVVGVVLAVMALPASLLHSGGANFAAADFLLVIGAGVWLARAAVRIGPLPYFSGNPLVAPSVLFVAVIAASLAWSQEAGATIKSLVQITEIVFVTTLMFASAPQSVTRIRRGVVTYIAVSSALGAASACMFIVHLGANGYFAPTYLPGLSKNSLGAFLGVGLVLAYTLSLQPARAGERRWWLRVLAVVELAGLIGSFSRGAILGAAVALLVATLLLRRGRLVTVLAIAGVLGVVALTIQPAISSRAIAHGGYDSSLVRTYSWAAAVHQIEAHPLLGTGAGTYWVTIPQLGIGLSDPNNMFLYTWGTLGVAGVTALLFLLYRFARTLLRARAVGCESARYLAVGAGCAALSRLVHFQVDVTWTRGWATVCFALMGLMVAAIRLGYARAPRRAAGLGA